MSSERGPDGVIADLIESFRQVGESGQAGLAAARDAGKAMRTLVSADVSQARSAFGRASVGPKTVTRHGDARPGRGLRGRAPARLP